MHSLNSFISKSPLHNPLGAAWKTTYTEVLPGNKYIKTAPKQRIYQKLTLDSAKNAIKCSKYLTGGAFYCTASWYDR
jgi:hypothetical protein